MPDQPEEPVTGGEGLGHCPAGLGEIVPPIVLSPLEVYAYAIAAGLRALDDLGIGAGLNEAKVRGARHG